MGPKRNKINKQQCPHFLSLFVVPSSMTKRTYVDKWDFIEDWENSSSILMQNKKEPILRFDGFMHGILGILDLKFLYGNFYFILLIIG